MLLMQINYSLIYGHSRSQSEKNRFGCSNSSSLFEIALISFALARSIYINVFYDMFIRSVFGTIRQKKHISKQRTPKSFDSSQKIVHHLIQDLIRKIKTNERKTNCAYFLQNGALPIERLKRANVFRHHRLK